MQPVTGSAPAAPGSQLSAVQSAASAQASGSTGSRQAPASSSQAKVVQLAPSTSAHGAEPWAQSSSTHVSGVQKVPYPGHWSSVTQGGGRTQPSVALQ